MLYTNKSKSDFGIHVSFLQDCGERGTSMFLTLILGFIGKQTQQEAPLLARSPNCIIRVIVIKEGLLLHLLIMFVSFL
jgi:hypothetical protein